MLAFPDLPWMRTVVETEDKRIAQAIEDLVECDGFTLDQITLGADRVCWVRWLSSSEQRFASDKWTLCRLG
jgi:hypothetical protein